MEPNKENEFNFAYGYMFGVLGLIAGVMYASSKGKSKLGYGVAGYFSAAIISNLAQLIILQSKKP